MIPLTVTRNQSGPLSWVSPDDLKEWAYRAKLYEDGQQEADLLRGLQAEEGGEVLDGGHGFALRM